jgi:hypothetical protein
MRRMVTAKLILSVLALSLASCATTNSTVPAMPDVREGCDALEFDISLGHINGLTPDVSQDRLKMILPCSTGATEDGADYNYGGGVFFLKHDFFVYTGKNFIEVRTEFKGRTVSGLMGKRSGPVQELLGEPKRAAKLPDTGFHPTAYGCARVEYQNGAVVRLAAHLEACETVMEWYDH